MNYYFKKITFLILLPLSFSLQAQIEIREEFIPEGFSFGEIEAFSEHINNQAMLPIPDKIQRAEAAQSKASQKLRQFVRGELMDSPTFQEWSQAAKTIEEETYNEDEKKERLQIHWKELYPFVYDQMERQGISIEEIREEIQAELPPGCKLGDMLSINCYPAKQKKRKRDSHPEKEIRKLSLANYTMSKRSQKIKGRKYWASLYLTAQKTEHYRKKGEQTAAIFHFAESNIHNTLTPAWFSPSYSLEASVFIPVEIPPGVKRVHIVGPSYRHSISHGGGFGHTKILATHFMRLYNSNMRIIKYEDILTYHASHYYFVSQEWNYNNVSHGGKKSQASISFKPSSSGGKFYIEVGQRHAGLRWGFIHNHKVGASSGFILSSNKEADQIKLEFEY